MSTLFDRFKEYAKETFGCDIIEVEECKGFTAKDAILGISDSYSNNASDYCFNKINESNNNFCFKIDNLTDYAA